MESAAIRAETINGSHLKRAVDVVGAALLILSLFPVLLVIGLAVAIDGPGSVLSRQQSYGRGKRVFWLYEFRTAYSSEAGGTEGIHLTRVGGFLLRTGLFALPRLLNVLRGDMSFVGPRANSVAFDDRGASYIPNYLDRHLVRPGLSGLAQVAGLRSPGNLWNTVVEDLRQDRIYIRCWSVWLDLQVLARAPRNLLYRDTAREAGNGL
jgi:putative colanic acid biosynthesis UDP-glucose lipid carrier transferase